MPELWDIQSDELTFDYDEEQALLQSLFTTKCHLSLDVIHGVIASGQLTFDQLLQRYEENLMGWLDDRSQHLLQFLRDGQYLQEVWSWISATEQYKKWVNIYLENEERLTAIAEYYQTHDEFGFDLRNSSIEARNELYLAQTQPGDPNNFNLDRYTGVEEEPEENYVQASIEGDGDYDRYYLEEDEELFEDRGIASTAISDAETKELKPVDYTDLRRSDVGKRISDIRQQAIKYRRENFIQRRDWKKLGLAHKPEYLDESKLQTLLKVRHAKELQVIGTELSRLSHEGVPAQDLLLLLIDGTYIDFVSRNVRLQSDGASVTTLQEFGQLFADEVLDHALALQDPAGWHESNDAYYARLLSDRKPVVLYDDSTVETSRLFNEVVLEHILSGSQVSEGYRQAYHAIKMAQSPSGESAYRQAVHQGKSRSQAMHAYYDAAYKVGDLTRPRDRIVAVHPDRMIVLTAASQFAVQREISWKIARLKAANNELYVQAEAPSLFKQQVFQVVKSLNWHLNLIGKLKE